MPNLQLIKDLSQDASDTKLSIYLPSERPGEGATARDDMPRAARLEGMLRYGRTLLRRGLDARETDEFLRPLEDVLFEKGTLDQMPGPLAIFRGRSQLRVLSVPVEVPQLCVVADSYHVKPVLRWLQRSQEFHCVVFHRDGVSLVSADDRSYQRRGTIECRDLMTLVHERNPQDSVGRGLRAGIFSVLEWIRMELQLSPQVTESSRPARVFLAGPRIVTDLVKGLAPPRWFERETVGGVFARDDLPPVLAGIRGILKKREDRRFLQKLAEFEVARGLGHTRSNLQRIADAALRGSVKRLFIAADEVLWGRWDRRTGRLLLNSSQQDHRDDDVLDDLAEMVLRRGGDVIVESRDRLPDQRPVSAIVTPVDHDRTVGLPMRSQAGPSLSVS